MQKLSCAALGDAVEVFFDSAKAAFVKEVKDFPDKTALVGILENSLLSPLFSTAQTWSIGSTLQKSELARERFTTVKRIELQVVSSSQPSKLRFANGVATWAIPFGCWTAPGLGMKGLCEEFCAAIPLMAAIDTSIIPKVAGMLGKLLSGVELEVNWKSIVQSAAFVKMDDEGRKDIISNRLFDLLRTNLR